jgi:ABC-type transport system involved in multi-copper enzyme maturation permease subunit
MQTWALIADSFRESVDRKIFWVLLLIEGIVAAAMFCIGFSPGKVDILFGTWSIETVQFTTIAGLDTTKIAGLTVHFIMDVVLGWAGVTLAIIATANFFPTLLERGAVEVLLSKPMSRTKLFIGKYLGSMAFIGIHATIFIVATFFVIGWRWRVWLPGYLLTIPLLMILFSYLYAISAWAGVMFRSTVAAVLLSLGAWVAFAGVQAMGDAFDAFPTWKENRWAYGAVSTARWCIPKTHDITYLAAKWSGAGTSVDLVPDVPDVDRPSLNRAAQAELDRMNLNPLQTIGSSLLFEGVILLLALWKFSRSDY